MATITSIRNGQSGSHSLLSQRQQLIAQNRAIREAEEAAAEADKNRGGFFSGLGYFFEKLGLGFMSSIEGIWDYTAGGFAKLFGADDWAEQQFANDWVNYNHADEWYNPSDGWKVAGDVAGGIGTSLPAIGAAIGAGAIAVASGGTLTPLAAKIVTAAVAGTASALTAGLGAAGNATKEAYRETGELGGKEFGYGALVGLTEGAIEGVSNAVGAGTGAIVKNMLKSTGKQLVTSVGFKAIAKAAGKGFVGEALEEGIAEFLDPYWKRITYDPDAENATFQEVAYASLVGGLSGALMGGFDASVRTIHSQSKGKKLANSGKTGDVIATAENIAAYQTENQTEYESVQLVNEVLTELKTSLESTNGEVKTWKQQMLLGALEKANVATTFEDFVTPSVVNIVNNAEAVAERMTAYGYTDANGNKITVTAEQLRAGIDTSSPKSFRKTVSKAIKNNSQLRGLAILDAAGRLTIDTAQFTDATLRGQQLSSQADLNRFVERADEHELTSVGEKLGISDWNTITNEQFQEKITQFVADGGVESYRQEHALVQEAKTVDPTTAKTTIPRMVNLKQDGSYRYTQGNIDLAIVKRGDSYRIFDYESGRMSKPMSRTEINKALKEIRNTTDSQIEAERQFNEKQEARKRELEETDTLARENIDGYSNLSAPNQAMIRLILRQAKASGLTQDFALTCARISARSGLNIVFSKEMSFVAADGTYADGAIDLKHNRIIINPESKNRSGELILIHELTHAIYKSKDGVLTVAEGVETMSAAEKEKIRKRYAAVGQGGAVDVADEINANFAGQTLSNKNILERLVAKKPTIKDKILSFFTKAKTDYQGDTKLTGAAARLFKQYQKLFDSFAESNYQRNSMETPLNRTDMMYALVDSLKKLGGYTPEEVASIERNSRYHVANSYESVKAFISAALKGAQQELLFLGKISDTVSAQIREATGIEVENKSLVIESDNTRHIFNNHGTDAEVLEGQVPVTRENFENIIETLIEPDSVYPANKGGEVGIRFVKEIKGRTTAITIVSEKKKALTLKSAWITKEKQPTSLTPNVKSLSLTSETGQRIKAVSTNSISENSENVNPKKAKTTKKFALPMEDSDGQPLNAAQREFFADSKVVDEQGRLRKVYHGTGAEEFFTFDKSLSGRNYDGWSAWGRGFYFAGNTKSATRWAGKSRGGLARVVECYLNLTNPFMLNADAKNTALGKHLRKEYNLSDFDLARGSMVINFLNEKNIDVAELLQRFGYDGVIAPDYNEGGDYMVIEPNQIKLTTNKNPSKQDDIRYALEIDGEMTPVDMETGKNLVALHNLSAEKLQKSIELGGFPMPSIAITTTELAHNNYGGITVVFGRETIDPESDSRNVVYDRDAWTPTKPRVDVKLNEKRVDSLIEELSSILKGTPYDRAIERFFDGHYRDNNGDYVLSDFDYAKEHIGANAYGNNGFLAAYLAEKGIDADIEPIFVDKGYLVGGRSFSKRELSEMLEAVGISKGQTRENTSNEQRAQMLENYIRYESRKRGAFLRKKNPDITEDEIVERYRDDYGDWHVDRLFVVAEEYFDESRSNSEYDEYATRDKLKRKITDKEDFYSWVWDKIQTTYEKRGIDNESDVFDSRGNRRSFEQRHFNYTVQNIVKAMSKGEQEGVANAVNAGALAAKLAKQFVSVEDIREAKDYLALVSEEDMKAFNSKTYKLYDEIVTSIVGYSSDFMRDTNRRNDVGEIIGKCATERPLTVERIKRRFANETKGYNPNYKFNDKIANMVLSLFEALRHIPTTYFEAKPRRAISFSEVKNIILPKDTDAKLISSLKKNGIPYTLYGVGGLSPASLKLWFDQIGKFIAEKVNIIQDSLSGESAAEYIRLNLTGLNGETVAVEHSLQDLVDAFRDGNFADYLLAYGAASDSELKALQTILYEFSAKMADNRSRADTAQGTIDDHSVSPTAHSDIRSLAEERWGQTVTNDRIVDNFSTDVPTMALSAAAGKKLNDRLKQIDEIEKKCVVGIRFDAPTGILTILYRDGTSDTLDLPTELMIEDGSYNEETKCIDFVLHNGNIISVPVQQLVNEYYGDGETIELNRGQDGKLRFSLMKAIRDKIDECIADTAVAVANSSQALTVAYDSHEKSNTAAAQANRAKAQAETADVQSKNALETAQEALERVVQEAGGTILYENGVAKAVFEVDFIAKACAFAHYSREAEEARGYTKGGEIDRLLKTLVGEVKVKLAAALNEVNEAIESLGCVPMANYAGQAGEADVASGYSKSGAIAKKLAELENRIKNLEA